MPTDKVNWILEGSKMLICSIVSVVSAVWVGRGMLDEHDRRISVIESKIIRFEADIVPRSEHNAHWDALAKTMDDLRSDIKDIRRTQSEIVQKVGK